MKPNNFISLGIIAVVLDLLIYAGLIGGGIYFFCWCLKHFGIMGG